MYNNYVKSGTMFLTRQGLYVSENSTLSACILLASILDKYLYSVYTI